jgi:hypothetical protein
MSTIAAPYGLKPVNLIGGQPYAGSTRQLKMRLAMLLTYLMDKL